VQALAHFGEQKDTSIWRKKENIQAANTPT
jgi:hypothetical protein